MPYLLVFVPLYLRLPIYLFIQHVLNQCCILYNGSLRDVIWNKTVTNFFKTTFSFHIKCLELSPPKFWFLRKDVKLYKKLSTYCIIHLWDQQYGKTVSWSVRVVVFLIPVCLAASNCTNWNFSSRIKTRSVLLKPVATLFPVTRHCVNWLVPCFLKKTQNNHLIF